MRKSITPYLAILALGLSTCLALPVYAAKSQARSSQAEPAAVININKASAEELISLKGIGPVLADRVIAYRNEHGPFQKPEDLKNVRGIGDPTYERIKDHVTL